MNSDQPLNIPVFEVGEVAELLQKFVDTAERSVEATADELIKVRVGGSFNVLSIEILDRSIDRPMRVAGIRPEGRAHQIKVLSLIHI